MSEEASIETISGWHGRPIRGVRSRGSGVFHALDWRDLVLDASGEIMRKRTTCRQSASFAPAAQVALRLADGLHTDLQSLHSEDTVTWAAFGPTAPASIDARILEAAFGASSRPATWERLMWPTLWENPDGGGRPEPDVVLRHGDWCFVIEAKWRAGLDASQGKGGRFDQLQLRHHIASSASSEAARRGVLVIVPRPDRYPHARHGVFSRYFTVDGDRYRPLDPAEAIGAQILTWEQVAQLFAADPLGSEIAAYLEWRLGHLDLI